MELCASKDSSVDAVMLPVREWDVISSFSGPTPQAFAKMRTGERLVFFVPPP